MYSSTATSLALSRVQYAGYGVMAMVFLLLGSRSVSAQWTAPKPQQSYRIDGKLNAEAERRLKRGADYLLANQNRDGSWGDFKHPAIAALCVMALHDIDRERCDDAIARGMEYILTFEQPDGSIYPAERDKKQSANYPNYTTSIVLLTMAILNRPEDVQRMQAARKYLQKSQFKERGKVDFGGIGYGKTGRADLSNGSWASEALAYSEYIEREPFVPSAKQLKRTRKAWTDFAKFVSKCQNLPDVNTEKYVSKHPDDQGGFFYRPNESKAGTREDGGLVSSGSMTYAGLKSMIHANLKRTDPRVKGAIGYLKRNYTVKENPGMGMQGLFYYLHVMTKALDAYGDDYLVDATGAQHDWREDVLNQFISLQHVDGSWANEHGRYMESMPALATSYSMIAMKVALRRPSMNRRR